jgi:DMSO/TMAO reductase YedYZ molybdopterin-dependent catalytic subunit
VKLPPGQHTIGRFPRFGTHLHRPAPAIPADPAIEVTGAVTEPFTVTVTELAELPRTEQTSDFHCVAGWSATGLRWEGVPFATFYRTRIEPSLTGPVTHLSFRGLDRYRSVVTLEDALADDVLIADRLAGRPLDSDHGAPVRFLSPGQYGFISTKHLCRIEVHTSEPERPSFRTPLIKAHPRARVWEEERHPDLPAKVLRPIYLMLIPPFLLLCARGSRR